MLPARRRRLNCPPFDFPPPDLTAALVELYFACVNPVFPVLQRTKFDQRLQEGLHLRDRWFGATLLMVCALGARFSADPRTLLDGCEDWLSAGYRWFRQVPWLQLRLYRPASLYEVQTYELMTIYVLCSSTPQVAWTLLGIACRYAVELGLHRRDGREQMPLELEWQRAFWVLVALDRLIATFLGHPTTFQCEDVDVDLPIDTEDDTCRLDDERALAHVPPSACLTTEYMSCFIRLTDVLDATLRSFYWKASKYQEMTGCSGPEWEQRTVSTLDSALNEWVDSIPEYLRWDPDMKDYTLFQQSCALYSVYYYTQIQVHRPFITKNNPLYPASISVCAHAARSHAHIVAAQLRRHQVVALPQIVIITFNVGIILLIQIWRKKKNSDVVEDMSSVRQDVQSCLDFLKECELV
ncbi:hypothetical protein FISHEDRAFT_32485 [Fistulina hepatica ATCC 64428]|uniref:Xylanolytic transcriptional activator regulatory domain-containing protein n=1 Tax=Fistulina hepatica ATCC 64428 TaxID=1128425 RepID=A0A0D7APU9_9AGAR|nr:hypothetical protein FISHEDRAFT_32485 [Fistulina hepatica ATCC 64428]